VNRAGDQLLAGRGFSLNQDRGISRRDAFDEAEHGFHGGAATDDLLEPALIRTRVTLLSFDGSQ
jgi:hypothetical protein